MKQKVRSKQNRCNAIDTHCKTLMDNETTAKEAAGWHRSMTYIEPETVHLERAVCGAVIELIILSLHVSRSMAAVLAIDDARGRANKKCVACLAEYRTTTFAYNLNIRFKKFQLTREYRLTTLSGELKTFRGKMYKFFLVLS